MRIKDLTLIRVRGKFNGLALLAFLAIHMIASDAFLLISQLRNS